MRFAGTFLLAVFLAVVLAGQASYAQHKPAHAAKAASEFMNFPGLPTCMKGAVRDGDPTKGAFVILAKSATGCGVPWHWHSANEQLMMVAGTARVDMKDGSPITLHAGSYAKLPAKGTHRYTCVAACTSFIVGDGAFDIHYVDKDGKEIPADEALKSKAKAAGKKMEKKM